MLWWLSTQPALSRFDYNVGEKGEAPAEVGAGRPIPSARLAEVHNNSDGFDSPSKGELAAEV